MKIPTQMEVAERYKLLALLTLSTLFTLVYSFKTALHCLTSLYALHKNFELIINN